MKYARVLAAFHSHPWAILPGKLAEMQALLALRAAGGKVKKEQVAAVVGSRRPDGTQMVGRVAMVTCFGAIAQRVGFMGEASGGVGTEKLASQLDALVEDKQVRQICLVFDSPGGSVFGVQELGEKIRGYRGVKKVVGMADSMAASAAYWLAAQCQELYCTPGGQVGSIGVLAAHEDYSKLLEEQGVKTTLIHAGKFKVEGNPYEPLGDDARADMQAKVDGYYSAFTEAVAAGRGVSAARVKADFGQGRMLLAADAKRAGMVDGVKTLQEVLERMGAYESGPGPKAAVTPATPTAQIAAARARALEVS